jgi:hypothetical protein
VKICFLDREFWTTDSSLDKAAVLTSAPPAAECLLILFFHQAWLPLDYFQV